MHLYQNKSQAHPQVAPIDHATPVIKRILSEMSNLEPNTYCPSFPLQNSPNSIPIHLSINMHIITVTIDSIVASMKKIPHSFVLSLNISVHKGYKSSGCEEIKYTANADPANQFTTLFVHPL